MRLIQSITDCYNSGQRNSLLREVGRRYFSAVSTEEYARRNYASNVSEYNTVIGSLTAQRRHFLLRDVYDDMMLDGVQPTRDTFHSFIVGTMKSSCLQDTFYFSDQMKSMGLVPDVIDEIDGVLGDGKGAVEVILKMVSADKKSDTRKENFPNEENHEST
ncbi:pentatricopeptide repeat-containing protein At4g35850, mitochondrial-like [Ziziphus jujuba]|uniref:Pentatricopeptide repeat-containing protein At4g35850, mitochondrial-like n=1 Tax=Ziziphus jujuba TaxID=326968 RepID=A0ABM4AAK4_ZIZJJ|nr:pentatricopeptide repeat-containing protein At4g35850, mitochondrial-like [Ziziphus jujuba var. spinosa]XP_060673762.1 pentatricopeptide repeat-containing protein At4g35850, mitochondrial-like [Ziziphus jujuba]